MLPASDDFIRTILEVEEAASLLENARKSASLDQARAAARKGRSCPQILIQAAELITRLGDPASAREVLREGLSLDGPTAPLQHAYSRLCRATGDLVEARHWLRGAMIRARPTATLALELCEIELGLGDHAASDQAQELAVELRWIDAEDLQRAADRLRQSDRPDLAVVPLMMIYLRREHDAELRAALEAIFKQHAPFANILPSVRQRLRLDNPATAFGVADASAHDRLVAALPGDIMASARRREASDQWVPIERLWDFLKTRIEAKQPFSFIRASDGEGRFVMAAHPSLVPQLSRSDNDAMFRSIWFNWFGQDISEIEPAQMLRLSAMMDAAYRQADLVGLSSPAMLDHDRRHFGYRAVLELWIETIEPISQQAYTDAAYNIFLDDRDPFFKELLSKEKFLGVVSPHEDLGRRLQNHLQIEAVKSYVIPGESVLDRPLERANRGTHFPHIFDKVMDQLAIPYQGACFLVAGGLLGKLYCARIKELGGIAIDVGAVADGWMGHNTRGAGLASILKRALPA